MHGRKAPGPSSYELVVNLTDRQSGAEIIESCRQGDRNAFRALYDMYKDRVYSISLYFFHGNQAMASDVTQQVFLELLTSVGQFRGEAKFSTWLYRLVVNECMDAARRRQADALVIDRARRQGFAATRSPEAEMGSHEARTGSQEEDYSRAQTARSVRAAVSALPPKLRMAVLLRYFDELSYEQMAKAMGCSLGTVASRLSRGHKILAEQLKFACGCQR